MDQRGICPLSSGIVGFAGRAARFSMDEGQARGAEHQRFRMIVLDQHVIWLDRLLGRRLISSQPDAA